MGKVVLAFSGGLDTSYCVKYLSEVRKMEVHTVTVNTGGFTPHELKDIETRAYTLGAKSHKTLEETQYFYESCIKYLVFGNILKNNTYPLSVSAERVTQAVAISRYAKQMNASAIAHGSTGAGNDQVRFDMVFNIMAPGMEIITPIRDNKLSRQDEIDFLKTQGVDINAEKAAYSINKGIWGTSVGGKETLTSSKYLPEDAFPTQLSKTIPEDITLTFDKGELKAVNGVAYPSPVKAIEKLSEIAAPFAIGRDIHVGDTIIGIKGRVGFEAAAPLVIIKAHHLLEKHILTKWQLYWKEQLSNWYGTMLHEGQYLDPVMRNIEKFLEETQQNITGTVYVTLAPFRFIVKGMDSPYDLMSPEFGAYGEMNNAWTGEDVKGYSKIAGNQAMIWQKINQKKYETVEPEFTEYNAALENFIGSI
jgi:argininosuccinate synthase